MSLINLRERTINAKVVYYGTALSGKTTSLKHVHRVMDPDHRIELVSLNTEGDRTLFFDFLPIPLGTLSGFQVKLQLFTVPGQVKYNLTRRYVLRGADAVVFVADSNPSAFDGNVASLVSLKENLEANGLDAESIPLIIQYNKRDLDELVSVEDLRNTLNRGGVPEVETIATSGEGVFEGFSQLACDMMERLATEYRIGDAVKLRGVLSDRLDTYGDRWSADHEPPVPEPVPDGTGQGLSTVDLMRPAPETGAQSVIVVAPTYDESKMEGVEDLLEQAVEAQIKSAHLVTDLAETKRRLADHVRHLAALHETGMVISSELDRDRLLARVLDEALRAMGSEHGSVLLLAEAGSTFTPKLVRGFAVDPLAEGGAADTEFVGRVLDRAPFVVDRAEEPHLLGTGADGPLLALVAPLVHQGEVLGALVAYALERPHEGDSLLKLQFLAAVAAQAAVAMENARLYARVEGFNRELERKVGDRTRELEDACRELQVLDGLKDDFLHSMSHELLTPLTSITSFAEILSTVAGDAEAVEERKEFASIVHREAARLTQMLQSVLDLSRLEAGKVRMEEDEVDLHDAVRQAYSRHPGGLEERRVNVRLRAEDDVPTVRGDARWIGKVLDALLSNAIKFSPQAGQVLLELSKDADGAVVSVHDQGSGVPEAVRDRIFEKFKQLGDVLTDKPPGLGVGLPMARAIMEAQGGRIWHVPREGGGSVFSFTLATFAALPAPHAAD